MTNQQPHKPECDFEGAKRFIETHRRFLLASHARTDGDDLGSILAMSIVLERMGKTAVPLAHGGVPPMLYFLPKHTDVLEDVPEGEFDALIVSGCKDLSRTNIPALIDSAYPVLNMDHHQDNAIHGDVNLVDKNKSCVAELLFHFFQYLGVEIDATLAKCLLTGVFTDTGSFMHDNTSAESLSVAGELMKFGARIDKIYKSTYSNKDIQTIKAWGKAFENARIDPTNNIVVSVLTAEDMREIGPLGEGAFTGLVDMLNTVPNTKLALFVRQEGDRIKGSIRSDETKKTDVFRIARLMGGGGHKLASAFTLDGKIVKNNDGSWKVIKPQKKEN